MKFSKSLVDSGLSVFMRRHKKLSKYEGKITNSFSEREAVLQMNLSKNPHNSESDRAPLIPNSASMDHSIKDEREETEFMK